MMREENNKSPEIGVQEVVETVEKYRKGFIHKKKAIPLGSGSVKKDNVPVDEVVEIINEQRKEQQLMTPYRKYRRMTSGSTQDEIDKHLSPKIKELKTIFEENGVLMEWEKIVDNAVKDCTDGYGITNAKTEEYLGRSAGTTEDFLKVEVQEFIIKKLEGHELIKQYIRLNREFEKRVKVENREQDVKNENEKRAQKSPKEKDYQKKRGVEAKEM